MKLWQFLTIFLINILAIIYSINEISISYKEADIFFNSNSMLSHLTNFSTYCFG
ncbi:MAG: hypothetical protein HXX81_03050, partial [Campylobacterales bacterium]|nr:hypothetical protein [Campylobacterales bacterium]